MIFKLVFAEKTEFAQAKSQLHLLQSYEREMDDFQDILEVVEISDEEAKLVQLTNTEYDPEDADSPEIILLFDEVVGDDFVILGSTEWL